MMLLKLIKSLRCCCWLGLTLALPACMLIDNSDIDEFIRESSQPVVVNKKQNDLFNLNQADRVFAYSNPKNIDPFNPARVLEVKIHSSDKQAQQLINRERELLESYSIADMSYVGLMLDGNKKIALLRVNDVIYEAGLGNYIGKDFGRIVAIADAELQYRESIVDSNGKWQHYIRVMELARGE